MTISSIHFQKGKLDFSEKHNFRQTEKDASYWLEKQYRKTNEYLKVHDVKELYQEQLKIRKEKHCRGFAPKMKDVYWEAVINLEEHHSIADVKRVADHIRNKYKLQTCSIAIHHDEGYIDKNDTVKYNHHAHLCFLTMENGISTMRKIRSKELRQMQTEVAQLLGMERGKENSKAVRLSHKQYRQVQAQKAQTQELFTTIATSAIQKNQELENDNKELKSELLTLKEQKAQIEQERKKYKDEGDHLLSDYRKLQALNKTLHTQAELDLELAKLRQEYEDRISKQDNEIEKLKNKNTELNDTVNELKQQLESKPKEIEVIKTVEKTVTVKRELTDDEIEKLPRVQKLNDTVNDLKSEITELQEKLDEVTKDRDDFKQLNVTVFLLIQAIHSDFDIEHPIQSLKKIYSVWKSRTQKPSIKPLERSIMNKNTIERTEVLPDIQNRAMSVLEQNTTKEREYKILLCGNECYMTAQDIKQWLEDMPEDKELIVEQLSKSDRLEIFGSELKTKQHTPLDVKKHISR